MKTEKVIYNSITLAFKLPARPWVPGTVGVGAGIDWSAAGVPSAWVTRRDRTLQINQRLLESEWPAFRAFLEWAQSGGTFAWHPDATAGTSYTCYLLSPTIDEEVRPQRGQYFGEMEVSFTIRRTDGAAIDEVYYV